MSVSRLFNIFLLFSLFHENDAIRLSSIVSDQATGNLRLDTECTANTMKQCNSVYDGIAKMAGERTRLICAAIEVYVQCTAPCASDPVLRKIHDNAKHVAEESAHKCSTPMCDSESIDQIVKLSQSLSKGRCEVLLSHASKGNRTLSSSGSDKCPCFLHVPMERADASFHCYYSESDKLGKLSMFSFWAACQRSAPALSGARADHRAQLPHQSKVDLKLKQKLTKSQFLVREPVLRAKISKLLNVPIAQIKIALVAAPVRRVASRRLLLPIVDLEKSSETTSEKLVVTIEDDGFEGNGLQAKDKATLLVLMSPDVLSAAVGLDVVGTKLETSAPEAVPAPAPAPSSTPAPAPSSAPFPMRASVTDSESRDGGGLSPSVQHVLPAVPVIPPDPLHPVEPVATPAVARENRDESANVSVGRDPSHGAAGCFSPPGSLLLTAVVCLFTMTGALPIQ